MGNLCGGGSKGDNTDESKRSKGLDRQLQGVEKKKIDNNVRVLLLGAGESGKSTVFKQLKIILEDGFSDEECGQYKDSVQSATLLSMNALVVAAHKFQYDIEKPENVECAKKIMAVSVENNAWKVWNSELADCIKSLWTDGAIQKAYERKNEFQIGDSAEYYFANIDRINKVDYIPSTEDILRTRIKTTGIVESTFVFDDKTITMIDVGGQRNERKKWIHFFEGVTAVLYVVSLSEYDQMCYEDDKTNRMKESLNLFEETLNSKWFQTTTLIVFMNKIDIFKKKITYSDPSKYFEEYTGGLDYDKALDFFVSQFKAKNREMDRKMYVYYTCATDTQQLKQIWDETRNVILKEHFGSTV